MVKSVHMPGRQEKKDLMMMKKMLPASGIIVVLSNKTEQEIEFMPMLQDAGYQLEIYDQPDADRYICCENQIPVALILDSGFNNDVDTLHSTIALIRSQCEISIPVIFISDKNDIAARLAAYRSGATHYLSTPLKLADVLRLVAAADPLQPSQPYRIMLVDDKSPALAQRAQVLQQAGMEVSLVSAPLQILEQLAVFAADVVLMEMDMPLCSGPELAAILHDEEKYAAIPIVYLLSETELLQKHKTITRCNENFLDKQASAGRMIEVISKHARHFRHNMEEAEILRTARYELERQQYALDAHAIVSMTDINGNIVYVNEKFCEISGYSCSELIGKNHRIIKSGLHPPELYVEMWYTISGGKVWQGEVCNRRKDGSQYWVYTTIVPFLGEDGLPYQYISIRTDITHVKQNEIAMQVAKEAAEAGSRAKSEFLASMSHELRTPLNAILGFSQLFAMDESLPQQTRDNAHQIEHAGEHLLSLVNDLIDLARIESNKMELVLETVEVKNVVSDSLNMVQSMAYNKGIKVELLQCDVINIAVWADFNRLRQSLLNLLTNAIKYNRPQGTVSVSCKVFSGQLRIAVSDNGAGIATELQGRIFSAFDRLGEERSEVEGTGIGLVITKRIMEAMGGSVGFESQPGQGSTFWLEMQLAESLKPAVQLPPASSPPNMNERVKHAYSVKPVILYVEDNQMNLRLMQQIFTSKPGWELCCENSAETGIEMARNSPPNLILLDINLPGMDGYQALRHLKLDPKTTNIPVIALTANAMKGDRERGIEAGFTEYLTKPLDIIMLLSLLDKLLDRHS